MAEEVVIDPRFNGPPTTANGGYACGVVAGAIGPSARVDLRAPPPLGVPLTLERAGEGVRLTAGGALVAEGRPGAPRTDAPQPPSVEAAESAARGYPGRDPDDHAFPTCFVCGPLRGDDGLRVFPGPLPGSGVLACTWRPGEDLSTSGGDGAVSPPFVWAALDCPSGFACMPAGRTSVLASMTAEVIAPARAGADHVLVSWKLGSEGRKHRAGAALFDAGGARLAQAEALWITIGE